MSLVPLLALAGTWQLAAVLIVLERVGKAIRNPPRGSGSLLFGQLFDRAGISILIPLTLVASLFAPLVFLGGFWTALLGCILWGVGMGVHESIVPAAVALMVPVLRRASAYGLFTAGYGVFWFLGSAVMGILYDVSLPALIVFCVAAELASLPFFLLVWRQGLPRGQTAT
jgi:predicted MFS family arabinose efflux permease